MTREEAIQALKKEKRTALHENKSAFDIAIKALEQEPCDDVIDRAEAMTEIMMFAGNVKSDEENIYIKVSDAVQLLRELPPANLQEPRYCDRDICLKNELNGIGCDECEVTKSQEFCEDYISRADLIKVLIPKIKTRRSTIEIKNKLIPLIKSLKPIQPKPKTDVLDKIRAEIEPTRKMYLKMNDIDWINGCDYVLSVIDKYMAESEGEK